MPNRNVDAVWLVFAMCIAGVVGALCGARGVREAQGAAGQPIMYGCHWKYGSCEPMPIAVDEHGVLYAHTGK
jgi:hypothetical protein